MNFTKKNTQEKQIVIAAPAPSLPDSEKLVYEVSWLGMPIGFGEASIRKSSAGDPPGYVLTARSWSNDFLSSFYKVEDALSCQANSQGYSLRYDKDIREGRYRANEKTVFDYDNKIAHWESLLNKNRKEIEIPGPIHDVLSAFYWFRMQPLEVGRDLKTLIHTDEKNWEVSIKVNRTERLELRRKKPVDVVELEPEAAFKGVLVNRGRALIYVTADSSRVPVLIRLRTPWGPVSGVLREW